MLKVVPKASPRCLRVLGAGEACGKDEIDDYGTRYDLPKNKRGRRFLLSL